MPENTFALILPSGEIAIFAFVLFCIRVILLALQIRKWHCRFTNEFVFRTEAEIIKPPFNSGGSGRLGPRIVTLGLVTSARWARQVKEEIMRIFVIPLG